MMASEGMSFQLSNILFNELNGTKLTELKSSRSFAWVGAGDTVPVQYQYQFRCYCLAPSFALISFRRGPMGVCVEGPQQQLQDPVDNHTGRHSEWLRTMFRLSPSKEHTCRMTFLLKYCAKIKFGSVWNGFLLNYNKFGTERSFVWHSWLNEQFFGIFWRSKRTVPELYVHIILSWWEHWKKDPCQHKIQQTTMNHENTTRYV